MRTIDQDCEQDLELAGPVLISARVSGDVTIATGANVRITGEIVGTVTVRPQGTVVLMGRIKGGIVNEGGAVDIFGFVGRVSDVGPTETWAAQGAIIGGQRVRRPSKLSALAV